MPVIARIELYHVKVPLPEPFYPSWIPGYPQAENRFDLIRVVTDDGVDGWSAGAAMGRERDGFGNLLGPYLIGEDPTDIPLMQQRVREAGYLGWRNWWIEPAFWDIKGKIAGKPVYKLLAGDDMEVPKSVTVYASTGEVKQPEARIEECQARYDEGFRTVKLRVHEDEKKDIRHVAETAKAIGDKMTIGVDANQAWRVTIISDAPLWDLERAKRFADACADAGLAWIEEPLPMDAYDDLAALTEYSQVPIAGGELHTSGLPELKMMIERGCYGVFQPDAVFAGGIAQTFEVAKLCRERGLKFSPHTWTNGVGFGVNLQVFVASGFYKEKPLEYPFNPPSWTIAGRDGILEKPFLHSQGEVEVPTGPGLGMTIDPSALRRFGKRYFVMDRKRLIWFGLRDRGLKIAREIDNNKKERKRQAKRQTQFEA